MNMKNLLFLFLAFTLIFSSCSNNTVDKELIENASKYYAYISAYTSGTISKRSKISIKLRTKVQELPQGILSLSPSVKGNLVLEKDSLTITFMPDKDLADGQLFNAKFKLSKLYPELKGELKTFPFQFETIKQEFTYNLYGYKPYSAKNLKYNQIMGIVETADIVSPNELAQFIEAQEGKVKLNVKWNSLDAHRHEFTIDSAVRSDASVPVDIEFIAKKIGASKNKSTSYSIAKISSFELINTRVQNNGSPYVSLLFSDPLKEQDLRGLIQFDGNNPKVKNYEINLNEVKVYPVSEVYGSYRMTVHQGVRNYANKKLKKASYPNVTLINNKPKIELAGNGNILPLNDKLLFPFYATALRGVHISIFKVYESNVLQFLQDNDLDGNYNLRQVGRAVFEKDIYFTRKAGVDFNETQLYSLDLRKFIEPEQGAIYRVSLSMRPHLSNYECMLDKKLTKVDEEGEDDLWSNNGYESYFYPEGYSWEERDNPCHVSFYRSNYRNSRNILASNFGIIAKTTNTKEVDVTISNLSTAKPMSNVKVKVYDYQKQLMGEGKTDSKGFIRLKSKYKPFAIIASQGKQRGYLKLQGGDALNYSQFDVNGITTKEGMNAFIYGERGVWRPGDSVHLTCILHNSLKEIPSQYPIKVKLYTPENVLYSQDVIANNLDGFYRHSFSTPVDAPTGTWRAEFKVGGNKFYKYLKIETVKPNKLKIDIDFEAEQLTASSNKVRMQVNWLHGAKAQNLKTNVTATTQSIKTKFKSFENYHFDNPGRAFDLQEKVVFSSKTNAEGGAQFPLNLKIAQKTPGKLKVGLFTKVFEQGGDFSTYYTSKEYSPYKTYVGLHLDYEYEDWSMLSTGKNQTIQIATVDEKGRKTSRDNIKVQLYKKDRNWWYSRSQNRYEYNVSSSSNLVSEKTISTTNGKGKFSFKVENDDYGRYLIKVTDPQSGHEAAQLFVMDWSNWRSRGEMGDELTTLNLKADKEDYKVGEKVKIIVPGSKGARILLSLENGTNIVDKKWFDCKEEQTEVSFKVTPEMMPNVYANITLIQPYAETKNDLPIRMFGIVPILVKDPKSKLEPVIKHPTQIKPQENLNISVSESNGKDMTYTIAVVDEGLLDITAFKTPDVWKHYNQKQALGVKSWDMYESVMGALDGKFANIFAVGGSDDAMKILNKNNLNRFKPVVKFLGPFKTKRGRKRNHSIEIPNYIGSLKVMVIAANQNHQYGSKDAIIKVKQPLMLSATMPRVLHPGSEITLPLTLFADKGIKQAQISIKTNNLLAIQNKTFTTTLNEDEETMVYVPVKIAAKNGAAHIEITAKSGKYVSKEVIDIPVIIPNPSITRTESKSIAGNEKASFNYSTFGVEGTNEAKLEISSIPDLNLEKRLNYLIRYPHGCVEQTTSSVFPSLYLDQLVELKSSQKTKIEQNIKKGIQRLRSMQTGDGGIGYWPGDNFANDWGTNYAGHFMLLAEKKGYSLPSGFKSSWIKYQTTRSNQWNPRASDQRYYFNIESHQLIQAYRLYGLALAKKANIGAMNRLREDTKLTEQAGWRLAAAYALLGKKEVAKKLVEQNYYSEPRRRYYHFYTYGSNLRDVAMKLETYSILGEYNKAFSLLNDISIALKGKQYHSTQSTSYALLSVALYVQNGNKKGLKFRYTINGEEESYSSSQFNIAQITLPLKESNVVVENLNEGRLFVNLHNTGQPLEYKIPSFNENLNMTVVYRDMGNKVISPSRISQGTDFKAVVTISNPNTLGDYQDLALSQIFPAGWEIINLRLNNQASVHQGSIPRYQDIRDDRVYTYFNLKRNETKTFVVLLNAAYKGSYILPAVKVEAMYEGDVKAVESNATAIVD